MLACLGLQSSNHNRNGTCGAAVFASVPTQASAVRLRPHAQEAWAATRSPQHSLPSHPDLSACSQAPSPRASHSHLLHPAELAVRLCVVLDGDGQLEPAVRDGSKLALVDLHRRVACNTQAGHQPCLQVSMCGLLRRTQAAMHEGWAPGRRAIPLDASSPGWTQRAERARRIWAQISAHRSSQTGRLGPSWG